MSVGLSQVDFDPKALEDEEEAALDKEDQEREQEIRELIANELDDDLLDDDNASFSSHGFRSATNSRASQQLDDSLHQESDSNSNDFADFPPLRGVFEKPPLMTQKGAKFISRTSGSNMEPYSSHQYDDRGQQYSNQSNPQDSQAPQQPPDSEHFGYHSSSDDGVGIGSYSPDSIYNEEPLNSNGNDYNAHEGHYGDEQQYGYHDNQGDHHESQGGYHDNQGGYREGSTHDDLGGYHGNQGGYHDSQGGYHDSQGGYHDNQGANDYDEDNKFNSSHEHHDDEDYGYDDAPVGNEHQSSSVTGQQDGTGHDQEHYTQAPSFPGNYRVQYVPGYRPQPQAAGTNWSAPQLPGQPSRQDSGKGHGMPVGGAQLPGQSGQNTVWRDVRQEQRIDKDRDNHEEGGSTRQEPSTNAAQLQVLYQARGRKIEELTNQLEKKDEEMGRQIRVLNHKLMMIKDEHAGMTTSLEQSQQIAQQGRHEVKQVEEKLLTAQQRIDKLEMDKQQVEDQLHTANSTIDSMNEQLVQMTRADALTKAREQHEAILNASRKRQEEEILRLKQKLDETRLSLDWKTEESSRLRDEVFEKGDIINRLTRTLDDTQRQCQELLKTGTVAEISSLRTQLQDAFQFRSTAELNCTSMKNEISELQEQLSMYQNALKYGFSNEDKVSDTFTVARNLEAESWATPKSRSNRDSQDEAIIGLRQELEHSLEMVGKKAEQVKQLEEELNQVKVKVAYEEDRAERMEHVALENEKKVKQLETDLQGYSSGEANQALMQDFNKLKVEHQESKQQLTELQSIEERLNDENRNLKQQMREMVTDFDKDKQMSLEKCRNACLQLHEDSKQQLRMELEEEHQQIVKKLNDVLEETRDELIRVKECYVQLREESRAAEKTIRDEMEKERDEVLNKETSAAIEALKNTLNVRHQKEMDNAHEIWLQQQAVEVERAVQEATKHLDATMQQKREVEIQAAVKEALEAAQKIWDQENQQQDIEKVLSMRVRWNEERETEMKERVVAAVYEARIEWEDDQREKARQEVDKAVAETKASVTKIHTEQYQKDLEHALVEARVTWQRAAEESRQKDVEQEVEVAVTNAVAEARRQWERDLKGAKDTNSRTLLAKEKLQWRAEEADERQKAVEAAIAIAEVKWLEEEQRKITHAVDEALHAARTTWSDEKTRDIVMAVDDARRAWASKQEHDVKTALETAHADLVGEFDERTREAVEMAVMEAKALWQRNHDHNNNRTHEDMESIKDKLWAEFEELKAEDIHRAVEQEQIQWHEEQQERQQNEVNKAITYLEDQYARGLEEFKHKELRDALAQARAEWEKERELEIDESRLDSDREQWRTTSDQATRLEVDRALATAREAWAANYQDELEQRVMAEVARVREEVTSQAELEKQRAVSEAAEEANKKLEVERKRQREELKRLKLTRSPEAFSKRWEEERLALRNEHEKELNRVREESTNRAREDAERELDNKLSEILQEAKQQWEEELEEERVQLEEQHQQKIKSVLEKSKAEYLIENEKAVQAASERAVKQQQQLWMNERKSTQSALDKIREEMTRVQQRHGNTIESLKRDHAEEMKKLRNEVNRTAASSGTQTPRAVESGSDTSFSSVDQLTAARGLHELRHQYLETVAKIRDDVLEHVKQTKTSAAKKIRSEVLKERHSTAKKLRKYYIQCLKQLLEDDKAASNGDRPSASMRQKIERMTQALDAVSPEGGEKGQQAPTRTQNKILPDKRLLQITKGTQSSKDTGRPGQYGPDGDSDSQQPSPSDKVLQDLPGGENNLQLDQSKQHLDLMFNKGQTNESSPIVSHILPEREKDLKKTEHAPYQKPLSVQRRSVGSTISVTSNESDYTELPTVIYKSPPRGNRSPTRGIPNRDPATRDTPAKSALDDIKARALARDIPKSPITRPVLHGLKTRGSGVGRPLKSTPPLPSKPTVKLMSRGAS